MSSTIPEANDFMFRRPVFIKIKVGRALRRLADAGRVAVIVEPVRLSDDDAMGADRDGGCLMTPAKERRMSAFEIREACLQLLDEVRRASPQADTSRPKLGLVELCEYLHELEHEWLPTIGEQSRPQLRLIRGGK